MRRDAVEATLHDAKKLLFFKVFALPSACLYLIDELDPGVFVERIYFVKMGADSRMLFRP